jgi:hypothetical protein
MKFWRPALERLSRAMEFANIDSLRELESLLESRAEQASTAALRPIERRTQRAHAISRQTHNGVTLRLVGQHR